MTWSIFGSPLRRALGGIAIAAALAGGASGQEEAAPPTPTAAPPAPAPRAAPDRVRALNFQGVKLGDVLIFFAGEYGLNIVAPAPEYSNRLVSARFDDVTVEQALDSIIKSQGLVIERVGNIMHVVPPKDVKPPEKELPKGLTATADIIAEHTDIRVVDVRYARGEDLVKLLQPLLTPGGVGSMGFDPKQGKLLVRDVPKQIDRIVKTIAEIDVPAVPPEGVRLPPSIKVVKLRYVETASLKKVLDRIAKAEEVEVEEEPTRKAFVLRGFPERIAAVERMIQTLDQRTQQVRIRVRIVETTLGDNERLGINWTVRLRTAGSARPWTFPFEAHTVDRWTFYPTPNPISTVIAGAAGAAGAQNQLAGFAVDSAGNVLDSMPQTLSSDFTFGILDARQFSAVIEAISTDATTKLVASPQVTTMDNKKAKINLGSIVPVPIFTNIIDQQRGTTFPTITGFEDIETGTILEVTPRIGADEYITLDVSPEISEITGFVGPNQERPVRSQRKMQTTVLLKSGATLALGGLTQDRESVTVNRVPFLGAIPLLGELFTHRTKELSKTELLIFITPELVRDSEMRPEEVAKKAEEEKKVERGLVKFEDRWVPSSALDAVNRIGRLLADGPPAVRRSAVLEVAGMADAERHGIMKRSDVLTGVMKTDLDLDVKRAAAEALGAVDPKRLAEELATLPGQTPVQAIGEVLVPMALRSPSRSIRNLIIANAIKVDRASTVTALMAAVAFGHPFERVAGAEGLALAADDAATGVLVDAIVEGRPGVAEAAADAIGACGATPRTVPALLDQLARRPAPGPHLELHLAAALAEAVADDSKLLKLLQEAGIILAPRTRELLALERRERRARSDRVLAAYALLDERGGPAVAGPPETAARVRDALGLLAEGAPGHAHLVAVSLRAIDVVTAADAIERVEGGRLKLPAAVVEATPLVHLAHDLAYHAAVVDLTAPPLDAKARVTAHTPGAWGHRIEEAALREQFLAIQALAGRTGFRDVEAVSRTIEDALTARGLETEPRRRGEGR